MLEVKGIENGIVIDHIPAGKGIKIFNKLFDNYDESSVVLLMNVESNTIGKKDIIKIADEFNFDLKLLGLVDKNITVNIIKDNKVFKKMTVKVPKEIKGGITCKNPRCISHSDIWAKPTFTLISQNGDLKYSCSYCEEITKYKL